MLNKNPKLSIWQVLDFFLQGNKRTRDIAENFDITINDACQRIRKLHNWGCIKIIDRKRPRQYGITKWGLEMLNQKKGDLNHD